MDIWSLGVTLYNMLVGSIPECSAGASFLTLPDETRGEVTDSCWQFVRRMLTVDQRYRMKYQELFDDPWLKATKEDLSAAYFADRKSCCDSAYTHFSSRSRDCVPMVVLERLLEYDTKTRRAHDFWSLTQQATREQATDSASVNVTIEQAKNTFQLFLDTALVFARKGAACEMVSAPMALSNYHIAVTYLSLIPPAFEDKATLPFISARMTKLETDLFRAATGESLPRP